MIKSVINRYKDETEASELIEQRMKDVEITTHISLKQALKKTKNMIINSQPAVESMSSYGATDPVAASDIKLQDMYSDVPLYDLKKGRMTDLFKIISKEMKLSIDD